MFETCLKTHSRTFAVSDCALTPDTDLLSTLVFIGRGAALWWKSGKVCSKVCRKSTRIARTDMCGRADRPYRGPLATNRGDTTNHRAQHNKQLLEFDMHSRTHLSADPHAVQRVLSQASIPTATCCY